MGSCNTPARVRPSVPAEHGAVAWDWGGGLLEQARRSAEGMDTGPLARLSRRAREELGLPLDVPIVASGHQPLFVHPGIALREILLENLPQVVFPLWIVVDSDAPAEVSVPVPLLRRRHTYHRLVLLENASRHALGALEVPQGSGSLRERVEQRLRSLHNTNILAHASASWDLFPRAEGPWTEWVDGARRAWGRISPRVRRVSVLELSRTEAYRQFVGVLLSERERFLAAYDSACRQAGVRPLAKGQLPFWALYEGRRVPAGEGDTPLVPRALMLTLAVRALLCDFFLHGAGGARYELGVDSLWESMWRQHPPAWGWLTGTFQLPEPSAEERALPSRHYPFFLHCPEEVWGAVHNPLSAI